MLYYPCTLRVSIALVVCLPLSGLETPTAVFFYMKILAYLNEKCNSNRRFCFPLLVVLRSAQLRSARVAVSELMPAPILAVATLRFSPRYARKITAAVVGLANYTKLFFCIIRVRRGFTSFGRNWQGKTAYGGSPPGTDGGRHWQNLVKSGYLINPQQVAV